MEVTRVEETNSEDDFWSRNRGTNLIDTQVTLLRYQILVFMINLQNVIRVYVVIRASIVSLMINFFRIKIRYSVHEQVELFRIF